MVKRRWWNEQTDDIRLRCEAIAQNGDQCCYCVPMDEENRPIGNVCIGHGGTSSIIRREKDKIRMYELGKWQQRVNELGRENSDVKSLRDEVGILRMMLERRFENIQDNTDLLLHSGPIAELIMKIDRLVNSAHKLEVSLGKLLDPQAAEQFAGEIVQIISEAIDQIDISTEQKSNFTDKIGSKILESLDRLSTNEVLD